MRFGLYRTRKGRPGNEHGGGPVEFELHSQRFFLLSLGSIDSDRLWHMRQVGSDPSRRGARYGSRSYPSTHPFKKLNSCHSEYSLNTLVNLATTPAEIKLFSRLCPDPFLGFGKIGRSEP